MCEKQPFEHHGQWRRGRKGSRHLGRFILKDCSPLRTHSGVGKKWEEEGADERSSFALTAPPTPQPHVGELIGEAGNEGVKLSQGRSRDRQGKGEGGFSFASYHPTLFLIGRTLQ